MFHGDLENVTIRANNYHEREKKTHNCSESVKVRIRLVASVIDSHKLSSRKGPIGQAR